MKTYIGTKQIEAEPQERDGLPGFRVRYADGYESWSPSVTFSEAYQPLDRLSFGHALVLLKQGKRVARAGWNGKGMWLGLSVPHATIGTIPPPAGGPPLQFSSFINGEHPWPTLPFIAMKTATDELVPWLASQTDMLAVDWALVE